MTWGPATSTFTCTLRTPDLGRPQLPLGNRARSLLAFRTWYSLYCADRIFGQRLGTEKALVWLAGFCRPVPSHNRTVSGLLANATRLVPTGVVGPGGVGRAGTAGATVSTSAGVLRTVKARQQRSPKENQRPPTALTRSRQEPC